MIETFLYGTWICAQVLYWFFLRHQTSLCTEEYLRMLHILSWPCPVSAVHVAIPKSVGPCSASS
jgi:hypothetical protein